MSKLILVSVQGEPDGKDSVADLSGLTEYLGYKPIFCIPINPYSLAESWFRLWSAFPKHPETINLFTIDESEATPIDALGWTDLNLNKEFTPDKFEEIRDRAFYPTDYIVKEIPEDRIAIAPAALLYSTEIYDYALGNTYEEKEDICNMFKRVQSSCELKAKQIKTENRKIDDNDILYDVLRLSGIISFLWQVATGNPVSSSLYTIEPGDFSSIPYNTAYNVLKKWNDINNTGSGTFPIEEHYILREEFLKALDIAAKTASEREAKRNGVGRNDLCTCGSGKKFKHCHAVKGIDDMIFANKTELV